MPRTHGSVIACSISRCVCSASISGAALPMPTAERSRPPADIDCCALSRIRCIDGEFIMPAAPRIVSVIGFVCRAERAFQLRDGGGALLLGQTRGAFGCDELRGDGVDDALERSAREQLVQRLGARRDRQQRAASGGDDERAGHGRRYSSRSFRFGTVGRFLDAVQIRYRRPRLEQRVSW